MAPASSAKSCARPSAGQHRLIHGAHLRAVNERSARLAWAVEQAARVDTTVALLWQQMNVNRTYAVRWATKTLLSKPDRPHDLHTRDVEAVLWAYARCSPSATPATPPQASAARWNVCESLLLGRDGSERVTVFGAAAGIGYPVPGEADSEDIVA
jgi:hypothetical protein